MVGPLPLLCVATAFSGKHTGSMSQWLALGWIPAEPILPTKAALGFKLGEGKKLKLPTLTGKQTNKKHTQKLQITKGGAR